MTRTRRTTMWLGLFAAASLVGGALGDTVKMRDGRVHEGTVVEETSATVVIETTIAGITTKLTLRRRDIRSIEIDPVTDDAGGDDPGAADDSPSEEDLRERLRSRRTGASRDRTPRNQTAEPTPGRYMVVPASGVIGVDVTAPGIAGALDEAEKLGATHVVFLIDSPGGYVYEALAIRRLLLDNRDRFTLHALVTREAISAATVLAAGSSTISMAPSATIGGATSYSVKADTGSSEVDAKMNSIWAAEMASIASTSGHDEAPFRAMIEQERELYVLRESSDGVRLSSSPPTGNDSREWERVDDSLTILTMTANQVRDYGIGRVVDGGAQGLGEALGLDAWHAADGDGAREMEKAAKERSQLDRALDIAGEQLVELADIAKKYNPSRVTIVYDPNTLRISEDSAREWSRACSQAASAWRRVEGVMDRLTLLKRKAEGMGALHLAVSDETIDTIRKLADEQLEWLHEYGGTPRTLADLPPDE